MGQPGEDSEVFEHTIRLGTHEQTDEPPPEASVPGSVKRFSWTWRSSAAPDSPSAPSTGTVSEPATYYEALSGRPDPMRDFFVTSRRVLGAITWIVALGIPVGIVAIGIATGQTFETVVFMGIFGLVVGMLFKSSFPRTPFG